MGILTQHDKVIRDLEKGMRAPILKFGDEFLEEVRRSPYLNNEPHQLIRDCVLLSSGGNYGKRD